MIIPKFWADARIRIHHNDKQFTVKKFGWSDESQASAEGHAQQRAHETVRQIRSGENFNKVDRKIAYNGDDGLPIREEIVDSYDNFVITRNVYGALCLNTPDVLFADIDFHEEPDLKLYLYSFLLVFLPVLLLSYQLKLGVIAFIGFFASIVLATVLAHFFHSVKIKKTGGIKKQAIIKIEAFMAAHQDWHLRLYQTPNGYRVMAMHDTFDPQSPETTNFMESIGTDPLYTLLCKRQNCFRARISPKPWRIAMGERLHRAVWPLSEENLRHRKRWVKKYDNLAKGFGSCRFIKKFGSDVTHSKAMTVQEIHDLFCKACEDVEIA